MKNKLGRHILVLVVIAINFTGCEKEKNCICRNDESTAPTKAEKVKEEKCSKNEIYDRKRKLCWDRCLIGERWTGKDCRAVNYSKMPLDYDSATASCRSIGTRLPTLEEFESVLGSCRDWNPPSPGWLKCNKCANSEDCEEILGPWFYHQGFGLWAANDDPRRVIIMTGWITPRKTETDPNEENMWAVCVRDVE